MSPLNSAGSLIRLNACAPAFPMTSVCTPIQCHEGLVSQGSKSQPKTCVAQLQTGVTRSCAQITPVYDDRVTPCPVLTAWRWAPIMESYVTYHKSHIEKIWQVSDKQCSYTCVKTQLRAYTLQCKKKPAKYIQNTDACFKIQTSKIFREKKTYRIIKYESQ